MSDFSETPPLDPVALAQSVIQASRPLSPEEFESWKSAPGDVVLHRGELGLLIIAIRRLQDVALLSAVITDGRPLPENTQAQHVRDSMGSLNDFMRLLMGPAQT